MKKLSYIFILFLTTFAITSCEVNPEVEFDHVYASDFDIDIPAGSKSFSFDVKEAINPMSSDDFAKYEDLIKKLDVNKLSGLVKEINKTVTITDLILKLSSDGEFAEFKIPSLVFEKDALVNFEQIAGEYAKISEWLKNKKTVDVEVSGVSSEDDVQIKFQTKTEVTVVADPL